MRTSQARGLIADACDRFGIKMMDAEFADGPVNVIYHAIAARDGERREYALRI